MRRLAVLALALCAGCAAVRDDCLVKDSFLGDVARCLLPRRNAPPPVPMANTPPCPDVAAGVPVVDTAARDSVPSSNTPAPPASNGQSPAPSGK